MSYIGCDKCGGYYELEEGESLEDFENCQCGGNLRYVGPVQEVKNEKENSKQKNFIQCQFCGQKQERKSVICSKCGRILRRKEEGHNRYDYSHVLEQSKKKSFFDRIEWWGIASGLIFLFIARFIIGIILFIGIVRLTVENANEPTLFAFFSGSLLASITLMIAAGFIAIATIKSRDYLTGIMTGGLVGGFIGLLFGTYSILFAIVAGVLGWIALIIGYILIYGALTAFGGLIAIYVRRHTSII